MIYKFFTFASVFFFVAAALAEGGAGDTGYMAMAVALGMGIAAAAGTLSQSRAAASALEGIARNPNAGDKVFVPLLLSLALMESLVLLTFVLMFLLQGKIGAH